MKKFQWIIASDLDGTLLRYQVAESEQHLPEGFFPLVEKLYEKGILFCAASGRAYPSLESLFAPALNSMYFLSENGAQTYADGTLLDCVTMPRDLCEELAAEVSVRKDCILRINTTKARYFLVDNEEAAEQMRQWKYNDPYEITTALRFQDIEGDITQMTAISFESIRPIAEVLVPRWKDTLGAAVTGEHWLDFTNAGKGIALQNLCKHLSIPLDHLLAFGDNFNDVPMLDIAGRGYIMEGSDPTLLERYSYRCDDVVATLEELLESGFFDR